MGFKKVQENAYYNEDNFTTLRIEGGKYYLGFVGGVRTEITADIYNALIDGLAPINNVYYYFSDAVSKVWKKQIGTGGGSTYAYYAEFNNGVICPIDKTAFDAFSANDYFSLNGVYYGLGLIHRAYELAGSYFVELKNGGAFEITSAEYTAITNSDYFKSVRNNYYNSVFFSTLKSENGEYFLDLVGGVRLKITSDEFSALTSGLTAINGLYYYYVDTISKAWRTGTEGAYEYHIEFNNGVVLKTNKDAYDSIIADGYYSVNDVYCHENIINGATKIGTKYEVEFDDGKKVEISQAEYEAITSGEQPEPETGFVVGQSYNAIYWDTSKSVEEMDAILTPLIGTNLLVGNNSGGENEFSFSVVKDTFQGVSDVIAISVGEVVVYVDKSFGQITAGWQDDIIYAINYTLDDDPITITEVNNQSFISPEPF